MGLLFKLNKEAIGDITHYFQDELPKRDNNYFYSNRRAKNLEKGDSIYFSRDSYIVAKAIFDGDIKTDRKRDEKFIHGHKLINVEIIDGSLKLNDDIVLGRAPYIKTRTMRNEINRVLGLNISIYPDEIDVPDETKLTEGAKKESVVNAYERNPKAREKCIEEYGYNCTVCDFNFAQSFGEIGENFIHVHHLKPLSETGEQYNVNPIEDLRPVCPNCHAMLHRKSPPFTIEDLQQHLKNHTN